MSENAFCATVSNLPVGDERRDATAKPASRSGATRYRAKIDSCHPANAREILADHSSCFLGVSLENLSFSDGKFLSMVEWIDRRCERCLILIGDSIHRKTLQIRTGISENEAFGQALELGRRFQERAQTLLGSTSLKCQFEFGSCSDIQSTPSYAVYRETMRAEFDINQAFRDSVAQFSESYIEKKGGGACHLHRDILVQLSVEYFLEELAIFACLLNRGFPVMVYPGSFSSLETIVEGRISGLAAISPRALMSLQIKGR